MIDYKKYTLDNGLRVIIHQDKSTPMVAVNTLYDVGARDEDPNRTGFAHLFEHLMFGGSINIPEFDTPLQMAGGTSNAFTSNDITNYYDTLPANNLDTALWLESDRMLSLAFTDKSLEVQRSVVIEEFKQRYINQPYGNVWHLIRKMAFKEHPYKWPTIGKDISHIEEAVMEDVRAFFHKHYGPQNAILCIAGNVSYESTLEKVKQWYGDIPERTRYVRNLVDEPKQTDYRETEFSADVPANALHMAFKMCGRYDEDYPVYDLITDILSRGKGSRFEKSLVREQQLFSDVSCYVTGAYDAGLLVVSGKLKDKVSYEAAELAVWNELKDFISNGIDDQELQKVKNKYESAKLYSDTNVLNRAMNLSFFELNGSASDYTHELSRYLNVNTEQISQISKRVFDKKACSLLRYKKA